MIVTIHKAKTELSKLIKRVEAGEEIEIARGKDVVARIVPSQPKVKKNMGIGAWAGQVHVSPDFNDTPVEDLFGDYENEPIEPPARYSRVHLGGSEKP